TGTAFATKLTVLAADAGGHPLAGVNVTFSAPGSGASAGLSAIGVVTDAKGRASTTATANLTTGTYTVVAPATGPLTANFALENLPSGFMVGQHLPDLAAPDQTGTTRHVSDFLSGGGYVLLTICGNWCIICQEMAPNEVAAQTWAAGKGIPFHVIPLLFE